MYWSLGTRLSSSSSHYPVYWSLGTRLSSSSSHYPVYWSLGTRLSSSKEVCAWSVISHSIQTLYDWSLIFLFHGWLLRSCVVIGHFRLLEAASCSHFTDNGFQALANVSCGYTYNVYQDFNRVCVCVCVCVCVYVCV